MSCSRLLLAVLIATASPAFAATEAQLPPAATRTVDFEKEIKPLFEATCIKCHAKGKAKGDFSLETRDTFLKGGETGPAAKIGHSADSLVVEMVAGIDPDEVMPKKGKRWTPAEVGLLRAWIDQGATWPESVTFARPAPRNLLPRTVALPAGAEGHPLDRLLAPYFQQHGTAPAAPVDDRLFARRVYLDVIGLLPSPEQLEAFTADPNPAKRAELVRRLLADRRGYADHWLSFWNDLLRNDYRGTGFIDGGRKQISEWLYTSLLTNKPYNQFVAELMNPTDKALGFTAGILWRGNVTAAMSGPMQAAQSVSQVFLGINLKCASCHDSFVSDWSLADAFGMAAVFSDDPLELVHCDKPTGQKAALRFLYPELGGFDAGTSKPERLQGFASLMVEPKNGRLSRTIVNRLWARLFGRGLVEPLDDMDKPAWHSDVLDWLAGDLEAHGFDLKRTLEVLLTSGAYALPSVEAGSEKAEYVFRGPLVRRLSAEQFADALSTVTGDWTPLPSTLEFDFSGGGVAGNFTEPKWIWTAEPDTAPGAREAARIAKEKAAAAEAAAAEAKKAADAGAPDSELEKKALAAAEESTAATRAAAAPPGVIRHRVIFRKTFELPAKPERAYASVLASQEQIVLVNGATVKPRMIDGWHNGRVRLYDLAPLLKAGPNVIVLNISSHTSKAMNETEARKFPASVEHLNKVNGAACFLSCRIDGRTIEVLSDETWRVQRAPEGDWQKLDFADGDWPTAAPLEGGQAPIDEGPGLQPTRRKDFANIAVPLGPSLRAACSTAALAERVRASMLAADSLQVALDRPNREIVITSRANSATTLQALELTNGATLASGIETAAIRLAPTFATPGECVDRLYRAALSREPSPPERAVALELVGNTVDAGGVSDLLWALAMLPEFQFIR